MGAEVNKAIPFLLHERLDGAFAWLANELEALFMGQGGTVSGDTLKIGFDRRFGDGYAACIIHAPIVQSVTADPIPPAYWQVLKKFNGAKVFAINLFGMLEDESNRRQCLSLTSANRFWINGYRKLPKSSFHFASRWYSWSENIGYFYDSSLRVFSARKSGEVIGVWPTVEAMLREECGIAKRLETEMRTKLRSSSGLPQKSDGD